jgi:hypothetical protein
MDTLEFGKNISNENLAEIFKNFFEQHMATYELLKGIQFSSLSVDIKKASIIYSIKVLDEKEKEILLNKVQDISGSLLIYGKNYNISTFMNGDLFCITINK